MSRGQSLGQIAPEVAKPGRGVEELEARRREF